MAFDYITEAFKRLDVLEEEMFKITDDGVKNLSTFLDNDNVAETVTVIDPEATTEDELQDSYIGKVIVNCNVCHSHIFHNKEDIVIDEQGCVNCDENCPYCGEAEGFVVVGEIAPFNNSTDKQTTDDTEELSDNADQETPVADLEDNINEALGIGAGLALGGAAIGAGNVISKLVDDVNDETEDDTLVEEEDPSVNKTLRMSRASARAIQEAVKLEKDERLVAGNDHDYLVAATLRYAPFNGDIVYKAFKNGTHVGTIEFDNDARKPHDEEAIEKWKKKDFNESLTEDFKEVSITTEDQHMEMTSDENGKVTVTTEPIKENNNSSSEEVVAPVSVETQEEILQNNDVKETEENSEEDAQSSADEGNETAINTDDNVEEPTEDESEIEFEEVSEEDFDKLGESFMREVYDNVESFKTTNVSCNKDNMIIEGLINFKSGESKKTGFIFEAKDFNSKGKLRFTGYNSHLTESKDAFSLIGVLDNKKLFFESLKYSYTLNDAPIRGIARSR